MIKARSGNAIKAPPKPNVDWTNVERNTISRTREKSLIKRKDVKRITFHIF
jgi:hypothetical protein